MSPAGKPRRADDVSASRVVVLVTEAERRQLFDSAKKRKQSVGELVRESLIAFGVIKP